MNNSKKQSFPVSNIGSVTLLMIFIIVCMVAFAALSVSTASSDYRSAERTAAHTKAYYQASNKAEETFAFVAGSLKSLYLKSADEDTFLQNVKTFFTQTDGITPSEDSLGLHLSYQTKMDENQDLMTDLLVLYPQGTNSETSLSTEDLCKIVSFRIISTDEWDGDNSLNLLGNK